MRIFDISTTVISTCSISKTRNSQLLFITLLFSSDSDEKHPIINAYLLLSYGGWFIGLRANIHISLGGISQWNHIHINWCQLIPFAVFHYLLISSKCALKIEIWVLSSFHWFIERSWTFIHLDFWELVQLR